jgi:glucosamine--fructose-6-phosphate aminotransferase (isomerizing)
VRRRDDRTAERSTACAASRASQTWRPRRGSQKMAAETGIAHTRWATHGAPLTQNAHPMFSRGEIALVHNGIIENYEELRDELKAQGYVFESQTDTEVIAHLVHSLYSDDLFGAVRAAVKRSSGAYAIAVVSSASRIPSSARAPAARW